MKPLRRTYEPLFQAHLMEGLKKQPIFQLMTGIPLSLEKLGFFEFMKTHRQVQNVNFDHTMSEVIKVINAHDQALASHILETEVGCIGLKATAVLSSTHAVDISIENLFLHLEEWIERLEKAAEGAHDDAIPPSEFNQIRLNQVILPLYPQLIFGAKTDSQKALISRLFKASPLFSHEVHALTFHNDYRKDIFSVISCEHEVCDFSKIAERAVHMGLADRLRDGHELGYLDYREDIFGQVQPNALLARFLNPCVEEGKNPDLVSRALMQTDITSSYATALVHTRLQHYLAELGCDKVRSMWLVSLAAHLGKVDCQPGTRYNLVMAGLALTEIVRHASTDPLPLRLYLDSMQRDSEDGNAFQLKAMTLFNTWFGNSLILHANHVRGTYSEQALNDLLGNASIKVFSDDPQQVIQGREATILLWKPLSLTEPHPDVKEQLASVFIDIICDKNRYLRDRHDLEIETPAAQALVDSGVFSDHHWKKIFRNHHAAKIMCKAVIPPKILKGADDKFLEMSLGVELGL